MSWINQNNASSLERLLAGLCYLTFGLVGLLYIIFSGGRSQSQFFRFHFLQSIILSIISFLLGWASNIFLMLISSMFGLLGPALGSHIGITLGFFIDLILKAIYVLLLYGMLWAFLGKYAEIPLISKLVRMQMH